MPKITTHREYIESFPLPVRRKLNELRKLIRGQAPGAEETISYGIAGFKLGKPLVYIGGFKNHVSFFPTSSPIRAFRAELGGLKFSTGGIRFGLEEKLPVALLKKMIRYRLEEIGAAPRSKKGKCDPIAVENFDYSKLDSKLKVLSKPAQRALINAGLFSLRQVRSVSEAQLRELHGMGPTGIERIKALLKQEK